MTEFVLGTSWFVFFHVLNSTWCLFFEKPEVWGASSICCECCWYTSQGTYLLVLFLFTAKHIEIISWIWINKHVHSRSIYYFQSSIWFQTKILMKHLISMIISLPNMLSSYLFNKIKIQIIFFCLQWKLLRVVLLMDD